MKSERTGDMGNILKDIFTYEEPQYGVTVKFLNNEAYSNFLNALNKANDEEKMVEVKGVNSVEIFTKTNSAKQILEEAGEIVNFFIGSSTEPAPYAVSTDYGSYTFEFERLVKKGEIVLKNKIDSIVNFRLTVNMKENNINIKYRTNPNLASSVENIITSYNAAWRFINDIKGKNSNDEVNDIISFFKELELYWIRVQELEKMLGIHFHPENINNSKEDQNDINKLYLLLVKKMAIRENLKDVSFTVNNSGLSTNEDLKKDMKFGMTYIEEYEYKILGEEFSIFFSNMIFNAIVDSIEEYQEKHEYIIKCIGTDSEPLFKVYKGHKTMDEAEISSDDFNKLYSEYKNTKSFSEIMKGMQEEYHRAIHNKG